VASFPSGVSLDATRNAPACWHPPHGVRHPVWAWLQYESVEKKRPDLRRTGHLGSRGVLIEFNASEGQLLLSDVDLWHYVLNRWYLPQTSNEVKDDLEHALPALSGIELMNSWLRIFDLDWYLEGVSVSRLKRSIQATIWQVPLSSVRSVTTFCAR
jgi:hypothetical protein